MHVLVFAPFGVGEYHFDTDLEIAQGHLEKGDRVTIAVCHAGLLTCELNSEHDLGRCVRCIGRHREGLSRLSPRAEVVPLLHLSSADRAELRAFQTEGFRTVQDLRNCVVDDFDLGWAVYSSLVTKMQGKQLDVVECQPHVRAALISALAVYRSMQNLLDTLKPERVYAFNGRFATTRAVLRAAQGKGIDCFIHERGSTFEKYALFKNHMPHEIDYYQGLVRESWESADPELRETVGASFYTDRVLGAPGGWSSFSGSQQAGLLPEGWREDAHNIVVFTSSTDENDAVANVIAGNAYGDQYAALDRITASLQSHPRARLYIRVHPRAKLISDPGAERLRGQNLPNVTVVTADSPVSTYALMRQATRVLTFGSTTGIEAAYWNVPSILGLRTFYDLLGATYNPKSHEEMMELLVANTLAPLNRLGALMYGYFQKTFGIRFRFFRPLGLFAGSFKDSPIKPHLAFRTAGWLLEHTAARDTGRKIHLKIAERRLLAR